MNVQYSRRWNGEHWSGSVTCCNDGGWIMTACNECLLLVPGTDDEDDFDPLNEWCETCHNTRWIDCHCGGDLCICENNGEMPCPDCSP